MCTIDEEVLDKVDEELKRIYENNKNPELKVTRLKAVGLKRFSDELYTKVMQGTSTWQENLYILLYGFTGFCIECAKNTKFRNIYDGYSKFCSAYCKCNNIEVKEKNIKAVKKAWHSKSERELKIIESKRTKTMLVR